MLNFSAIKRKRMRTKDHIFPEEQLWLYLLENCISKIHDMVIISKISLPNESDIIFVNDAFIQSTGYTREDVRGKTLDFLDKLQSPTNVVEQVIEMMRGWQPVRAELSMSTKFGQELCVELDRVPVKAYGNEVTHWISVIHNNTKMKENERRLNLTERMFARIEELTSTGSWEWDLVTGNGFWSDRIFDIYGHKKVDGTPHLNSWREAIHPDDLELANEMVSQRLADDKECQFEFRILKMDTGECRHIETKAQAIVNNDGKVIQIWGVDQDITQRKQEQDEILEKAQVELKRSHTLLEQRAHYDPLTGLPTRALFSDRLQQAVAQCKLRSSSLAVAFLDLDDFKEINDAVGHNIGDLLLISVAQRLQEVLREGDYLARLGGDEFVVVLADLYNPEECQQILTRLLLSIASPVVIDKVSLKISASIGVTLYPQDESDADLLIRHADQAMYLAKQGGKDRFHLFDVAHDAAAKYQQESLEDICRALRMREFVLYYQPKVNMGTGEVIGAEALIRWQHPARGLLPPIAFLPIVEGHPIEIDIGEWVIENCLQQIASWQADGIDIPISVNVGASQLQQESFVNRLAGLLASYPAVHPNRLELEILETSTLKDITLVTKVMMACRSFGMRFALDDFGTGYSSLTYLKRLPAEILKVDQSFVRGMLSDPDDMAIVQGVIGLAKAFGREILAEGVETNAHAVVLRKLGCEFGQGYGIARPMPAQDFPAWIKDWTFQFCNSVLNSDFECAHCGSLK